VAGVQLMKKRSHCVIPAPLASEASERVQAGTQTNHNLLLVLMRDRMEPPQMS